MANRQIRERLPTSYVALRNIPSRNVIVLNEILPDSETISHTEFVDKF